MICCGWGVGVGVRVVGGGVVHPNILQQAQVKSLFTFLSWHELHTHIYIYIYILVLVFKCCNNCSEAFKRPFLTIKDNAWMKEWHISFINAIVNSLICNYSNLLACPCIPFDIWQRHCQVTYHHYFLQCRQEDIFPGIRWRLRRI